MDEIEGFVKVIGDAGDRSALGVHILGVNAGDVGLPRQPWQWNSPPVAKMSGEVSTQHPTLPEA